MANAIRDNNRERVLCGVSYVDGTTIVPLVVDAVEQTLSTDTTHTFSGTAINYAVRDDNRHVVLMGVSTADDTTPVPVFADPATGRILIDTP